MPETAASEQSAETAGGQETTQSDQTSQESGGSETEAQWKARAREWEKRAKANAAAAETLAKIEENKKTDQQKLTDKLRAADEKNLEADRILLRAKVATAKGLTPGLAARLQGDTEEEILADAEALLGDMKAGLPKPDLKQGDRGAESSVDDVDAWIRKQAGR